VRELQEETGYGGDEPKVIGQVFSNPAIMTNTTYTVLVQNCRLEHEVELDSGEDLVTRLVPVRDIPELIAEGKVRHSLVVAALFHFDLWQRRNRA
jgi:8-oxo-dGTP pyrophosphatase MutT (NUDIX family)